jgi:predicted Zn-dependent protease
VAHVPASWEARLFPDFLTPEVEAPEEDEHRRILEELLARLAAHWPDNPYDLRIAVLRDDRPNALAFPGGVILITDGLLERAQTENELAFVMGHEFGHFRNRDHLRGLGRGLVLSLAFSAVRGSGVELLAVVETLTLRSFGREQEREADAFGLELVQAEYGHVGAATDFFTRLAAPQNALERAAVSYLSTHPVSASRIEDLRALAEERGWPTGGKPILLPERSPKARAPARGPGEGGR